MQLFWLDAAAGGADGKYFISYRLTVPFQTKPEYKKNRLGICRS